MCFFLSSPHWRQAVAPEHHWAVGWSFADSKHFGCWGRPSEDFHPLSLGVSINGNPPNGWFMMENPNLKWMICGYPFWYPHFRKPPFFAHPGWPPPLAGHPGVSLSHSHPAVTRPQVACLAFAFAHMAPFEETTPHSNLWQHLSLSRNGGSPQNESLLLDCSPNS